MDVILGKDAYIEIFKEGEYRPFICCETVEIAFQTEVISVKTIGDGIWDRKRGQSNSYTISLSGLIPYDEPGVTAFDLIQYQAQMVDLTYRMIFKRQDGTTYEAIYGTALVNSSTVSGPVDFATGSFNLDGNGPPLFGSLSTCDATIASITVLPSGGQFRVTVTPGAGTPVRFDYRIYKVNTPLKIYDTAFGLTWLIDPSLDNTTYQIEIIPYCENGVAGASFTDSFET